LTGLFPPLPEETRIILNSLPSLIDKVLPMPKRFRAGLPRDIADLSQLLTSERSELGVSYLEKPAMLSAYLRYFLPWNIYRLSRLFSSLPLELKPGDALNDIGAGPLTLPISLWISRSDLRSIPLEIRCIDRSAAVLEAGKKLFTALSAEVNCQWTVKTIRGEVRRNGSLSTEIRGKPAALSAAVNLFNELYWDFSPVDTDRLNRFAEQQARLLSSITEDSGSVLVVEPGIPRSGQFISLLRSSLIKLKRHSLSPCTHGNSCPMPGGQNPVSGKLKWCHFAFDTEDAPEILQKLSLDAKIPKERAVLSFIFAGSVSQEKQLAGARKERSKEHSKTPEKIRVVSDSFPLGSGRSASSWGRYGCCGQGLVLVTGDRHILETSPSGAMEELPLASDQKDAKSNAFIAVKKQKS